MKLLISGIAAVLASCTALPGASPMALQGTDSGQQIVVILGERSLDEGLWAPTEDQGTIGVEYVNEAPTSTVGWEVGFAGSTDDQDVGLLQVEATTVELYGGIRKTFGDDTGRFHPYLGAGLSSIVAESEVSLGPVTASDDDSSIGFYLHGGIAFDVSTNVSLGLDVRVLTGTDMTIAGVDADADYEQVALTIGIGF